MPLYDYRCHQCGEVFEVRQKFADEILQTHEGCGGVLERLISAPALQFKGTGWYVTDYGRGGKLPSGETKESKGESKAESKSDGKSESKGDGKPESKSRESKSESSQSESKSDSKPESKTESKSESKSRESKPAPASTSNGK
jgi:putative FmdB family regulatory protein